MNENEKHQLIAAAWINIKTHKGDRNNDPKHLENAEQYLKEVVDYYLAESKKTGEQA